MKAKKAGSTYLADPVSLGAFSIRLGFERYLTPFSTILVHRLTLTRKKVAGIEVLPSVLSSCVFTSSTS